MKNSLKSQNTAIFLEKSVDYDTRVRNKDRHHAEKKAETKDRCWRVHQEYACWLSSWPLIDPHARFVQPAFEAMRNSSKGHRKQAQPFFLSQATTKKAHLC